MLKTSKYNLEIVLGEECAIYNTLHGSLMILDKETLLKINLGKLEEINKKDKIDLIKSGVLLEKTIDELKIFEVLFNKRKFLCEAAEFIILPTYDCNLRCKYCFEGLNKDNKKMSEEEQGKTIKFIKKTLEEGDFKKFSMVFFGGEPFYNFSTLLNISENLVSWSKKSKIKLKHISIISNGTLLTPNIIRELKKLPVTLAITLNGPKEIHDSNRVYANGTGTYDLIIKNLKLLKNSGIETYIDINVDKKAAFHIKELLEDLKTEGLSNFPVNFGVVRSIKKACNYLFPAKIDLLPKLWNLALSKGFKIGIGQHLPPLYSYCKQQTAHSFCIDPFCDIYPCIALTDKKEKISTIQKDGSLTKPSGVYYSWLSKNPMLNPYCLDCILLPLCCGGCPILPKDPEKGCHCYSNEELLKARIKLYIKQNIKKYENISVT